MAQVSGDPPLLATKLFVPPPRKDLVVRPRLRDRLSATNGGRVTLIAASAGSGKSTLLADWASDAEGRVAWLSLDEHDDEPRRFLSYLIASLRGAEGIGSDELPDKVPSAPDAVNGITTQLINAIAARGAPLSLILDDYHAIESRLVHDIVQFVIDNLPPNLHLLLSTRVDPPLTLSRLRARGVLYELRGDDLRFNVDEVSSFLNDSMGLKLDSHSIAELERRTEGWAVGVQLAALSLSGRSDVSAFIGRFGGSNRYVLDYLTEEVLDRQNDEAREFLISTSTLTRLSPDLCDAVTGRADSARLLSELDAANLFLIPLDDVRYWYRYHHLFATLLQHHLSTTRSRDEVSELHQRAASWYLDHAMPESALDHVLAADDVDRAVAIVSEHALPRTLGGDALSALRWFDALPQDRITRDSDLLLIHSVILTADWQLVRAHETVQMAEALLTDDAPDTKRGAIMGIRAAYERIAYANPAGGPVIETLRKALTMVEPNSVWYSIISYQLGMNEMMRADARRLIDGLEEARKLHSRPEQVLIAVLAQTYTALAHWWSGNPDAALALANEMFPWIDLTERFAPGRSLDAMPYTVMAEVHLSRNELEQARSFAEKGVLHGGRGFSIALFEAARTLSRVAIAQRDWDAADRGIAEAIRSIRNVGGYIPWFHALEAQALSIEFRRDQFSGRRIELDKAERWLRDEEKAQHTKWERRMIGGLHCDTPLLFGARVSIEAGRIDEALAALDDVWIHASETHRVVAQIEERILRAIAEARRGHLDKGGGFMKEALTLAQPPGYLRFFANEGAAIVPLIERAASDGADRTFVNRVLASFDAAPRPSATTTLESLSDRELEVLKLVAAGATNQEAAGRLFIAPSTVKKHLENIYAKLDVRGRTGAVARARELGLL